MGDVQPMTALEIGAATTVPTGMAEADRPRLLLYGESLGSYAR